MSAKNVIEKNTVENTQEKSKDRSKLYFFVIALVALLATNLYFYVKYRSSGEKLYTISLQKENVQIELDRLEAELDNLFVGDVGESEEMIEMESKARQTIAGIRSTLEHSTISEDELDSAKEELAKVREDVTVLKNDVTELRVKNELLQKENERLNHEIRQSQDEIEGLSTEKEELESQVNIASQLKVSTLHLSGIKLNKKGEKSQSNRSKKVDKLEINFSLADNSISPKGEKEIFMRVVDPKGNLIADPKKVFYVHGEKLQYTQKENINFTNNGEEYTLHWEDPSGFRKGAYTILLYSDNAIMGRSSVVLR